MLDVDEAEACLAREHGSVHEVVDQSREIVIAEDWLVRRDPDAAIEDGMTIGDARGGPGLRRFGVPARMSQLQADQYVVGGPVSLLMSLQKLSSKVMKTRDSGWTD